MAIRVLHIIGNLQLGGAQVCVKNLVANMNTEDIQSFVFPLRCAQIEIPVQAELIKHNYRNYDPRKFFAVFRLCRRYNIDIIHAHLEKPILASLLASFFCKVPVIIHEHGPVSRKGWRHFIYRLGLKLFGNRASAVIAVSNATADCLVEKTKIDRNRIHVIYNGIDLEAFKPDRQIRRRKRNELLLTPDDVVVGFAGRLDFIKGIDLLTEAMGLLLKESPKYILVIAGAGPLRDYLESLAKRLNIEERVKFLGFVQNVAELMNAFDIGVVPSRQESLGITAIELMSMAVPIVSSGVEGLAEIVTNGQTALLPKTNTPEAIAACIRQLTDDQALRNRMARAGRDNSEQFSIDKCVTSVRNVYNQVLG